MANASAKDPNRVEGELWPSVLGALWANASLLGTVGIFAIVLVKITVVAQLDIDLALAILRYSSASEVVLGALVSLLPAFGSLAVVVAVLLAGPLWPQSAKAPLRRSSLLVAVACLLTFGFFTAPLMTFVGLLPGIAIARQEARHQNAPKGKDASPWGERLVWGSLWGLFIVLLVVPPLRTVLSSRPWIPAETLHLGGGKTVVGYVLNDGTADSVIVLVDAPRRIEFLRAKSVNTRAICTTTRGRPLFLLEPTAASVLYAGGSDTPPCDH